MSALRDQIHIAIMQIHMLSRKDGNYTAGCDHSLGKEGQCLTNTGMLREIPLGNATTILEKKNNV
jgi:hypothetical protein